MEEQIERTLDQYYDWNRPEIKDLQILEESPEFGILCIRWRAMHKTITVKSILQDNKLLLTTLT
ncbi:hypothetical protein UFOVP1247_50 [uncultured Caudovirales phage]|uniref:Uncharacterized protein n=1 Tax=uncultured Caudovirales phage TaxID=2100421 RepID=A0A6J5PUL4_9CAUD|nr:hypothetical protein UFOVP970_90 [uncultured Caudovirales phage]CAB4193278.1 hypothetical protein UFOVP1247_50 [uncultured Caudovirales phage]